MTRLHKTYEISSFKAFPEQGSDTGRFQAIVSVFGNVDYQGDRVLPGAFQASLAKWRASGDPIPVIWSHEWGNPDAIIGEADPNNVKEVAANEVAPGSPPGLFVDGLLHIEKPFAAQVYDLMRRRLVKEFSFAYDVVKEQKGADGENELAALDIIENGPTLKGANNQTVLVGVKSQLERAAKKQTSSEIIEAAIKLDPKIAKALIGPFTDDIVQPSTVSAAQLIESAKAEARAEAEAEKADEKWDGAAAMAACSNAADFKKIAFERAGDEDPETAAHYALPHHPNPDGAPDNADPQGVTAALGALNGARGGAPDLKDEAAARSHLEAHASDAQAAADEGSPKSVGDRAKNVYAPLPGTDEERNQALRDAVSAWALTEYPGNDPTEPTESSVWTSIVGTYSDRVVVAIEDRHNYDAEPEYRQFDYSVADDGTVTLGAPSAVEVEVQLVAKNASNQSGGSFGTKAGRVIGSKAAAALKSTLSDAVDAFVADVNGSADGGAAAATPEEDAAKAAVEAEERAKGELERLKSKLDDIAPPKE